MAEIIVPVKLWSLKKGSVYSKVNKLSSYSEVYKAQLRSATIYSHNFSSAKEVQFIVGPWKRQNLMFDLF